MDILKQIKDALKEIRRPKHKAMPVLEEKIVKKKEKIVKKKPEPKRKVIKVEVEGVCLSLPEIAKKYGLDIKTVEARYRVGNRGKLLVRPSHRKQHT